MNPPPRSLDEATRKMIDEWLKNNEPTRFKSYERTDPEELEYKNAWGRKKKS